MPKSENFLKQREQIQILYEILTVVDAMPLPMTGPRVDRKLS